MNKNYATDKQKKFITTLIKRNFNIEQNLKKVIRSINYDNKVFRINSSGLIDGNFIDLETAKKLINDLLNNKEKITLNYLKKDEE